jgi:ABC-type phosphate transport system substrate-binding protein
MKMTKLSVLLVVLALAVPASAEGFKLIVNADQKTGKLSKDEVSRIFLKKVTRWDDGAEIRVVQPKVDSVVRHSFDPTIHKLPSAAVRAYWAQMVFSGRDVPPVEKSNDEAIVDFVKQNPGAIGVVSEGASLGSGVKVIEVK